jgi:hypothetical protein
MTELLRLAIHLEMRGDIWNKDGRAIFPLMGTDGNLNGKTLIFLKVPPPTSEADGIEFNINDATIEDIDKLIEARKATVRP